MLFWKLGQLHSARSDERTVLQSDCTYMGERLMTSILEFERAGPAELAVLCQRVADNPALIWRMQLARRRN